MPRPKGLDAGNDCPRRHSALCEATGACGRRCPEEVSVAVRRRPDGTIAKGQSGNVHGLRSLKSARKYLAERTNGNAEILDILLALARGEIDGEAIVPANVRKGAAIKLADVIWGREIRLAMEHSGTVTHEAVVRPALPPGWSERMTVAELEQFRALLAKATPEGAVDAEFTEAPAKGGEESEDE